MPSDGYSSAAAAACQAFENADQADNIECVHPPGSELSASRPLVNTGAGFLWR